LTKDTQPFSQFSDKISCRVNVAFCDISVFLQCPFSCIPQSRNSHLTPHLPGGFSLKSSSLHVSLGGHNSGPGSAGELFKPSKDLASLRVCDEKKFFGFGFLIFCEWRHKWSSFGSWPTSPGPRPKPLDGGISLTFYWKLG